MNLLALVQVTFAIVGTQILKSKKPAKMFSLVTVRIGDATNVASVPGKSVQTLKVCFRILPRILSKMILDIRTNGCKNHTKCI